ncbi:hypothetical protein [Endozoicomonas sp. GU-1]|uniref:hypothetical protein n=1 Tax=Endozoicomonas sp. GU-1 TaxID=3009078 RepID=UPI0022B31AC2|nr:hypothetical protein [Endozoicomonas sp. GU-1]WBA83499.1 hypothetical protein O2T12_10425 [Endozoicomonas sp. GU-1]WBA86433.1 hypothetical protein O3276_25115 [Endozoicomonas sp. GU-1]
MQAIGNITGQFDSTVTGPIPNRTDGQFDGRTTTDFDATRQTENNRSFDEKPSLKDRLIYPFYAAKNRILKLGGIGVQAGLFAPIISVGGICGIAGDIIGSTIGRLIQCLFFPDSDESPGKTGTLIGFYVGSLLAVPASVALGAVAAAAFAVIGLVGSVVSLPVDIYRAATQDNKADLHPEPVRIKDILNEIKHTEFSDYLDFEHSGLMLLGILGLIFIPA